MTKDRGQLLAVQPDGSFALVPNSYEGIKAGLNGATLDFLSFGEAGVYVDDDGMLTAKALNVPAALMFGMALYGPVVLCAGQPDDEGDTLPPTSEAVRALTSLAEQWRYVTEDAARKGQDVRVYADGDLIPPPQLIAMSDEDFNRFLETGKMP